MTDAERAGRDHHRGESAHPATPAASHGEEVHLPAPSIWPVVCAAAVTLVAFGVLTSLVLSVVGVLLLARGLHGWIWELRHE
jgi:hypothetical protein